MSLNPENYADVAFEQSAKLIDAIRDLTSAVAKLTEKVDALSTIPRAPSEPPDEQ
jgi:hypothetical protein